MEPPYEGKGMGCWDQGPPIDFTPYELSRVYDMLFIAEVELGEEVQRRIWMALPNELKLEFNYSNWSYCSGEDQEPESPGPTRAAVDLEKKKRSHTCFGWFTLRRKPKEDDVLGAEQEQ